MSRAVCSAWSTMSAYTGPAGSPTAAPAADSEKAFQYQQAPPRGRGGLTAAAPSRHRSRPARPIMAATPLTAAAPHHGGHASRSLPQQRPGGPRGATQPISGALAAGRAGAAVGGGKVRGSGPVGAGSAPGRREGGEGVAAPGSGRGAARGLPWRSSRALGELRGKRGSHWANGNNKNNLREEV